MKVGYVVLYVNYAVESVNFWVDKIGMILKESYQVDSHQINRVGFENQDFCFELVPMEMMKDNPDGLDLATPSICLYVEDIDAAHKKMASNLVKITDISEHFGKLNFAFSDNEDRWFAVIQN